MYMQKANEYWFNDIGNIMFFYARQLTFVLGLMLRYKLLSRDTLFPRVVIAISRCDSVRIQSAIDLID